jgi:hypothetical protein
MNKIWLYTLLVKIPLLKDDDVYNKTFVLLTFALLTVAGFLIKLFQLLFLEWSIIELSR